MISNIIEERKVFNKIVIDKFILIIIILSLLVDTMNGILLRSGLPTIGQPIRIILFYLICFRIYSLSRPLFLLLLIYYMVFLMISIIHFIFYFEFSWLFLDFVHVHRMTNIIAIWFYFLVLIKFDLLKFNSIKSIYIVNLLFLVFNLVVGIFGIGYSQYGGGIGSVGFFFAGNEVSGLMICLFTPILFYVYNKKSTFFYLFISALFLALAIIKVTKVAILGTFVLIFLIPLVHIFINNSLVSFKVWKYLFWGSIFSILVVYIGYIAVDKIGLIERIEYFYYEVNDGDIITTLLSGRNTTLEAAKGAFLNNYNVFEYLFGRGVSATSLSTKEFLGEARGVEIDPLDFLFQFGFVGFTFFIFFLGAMLLNSFIVYKRHNSSFALTVLIVNFLLIVISSTAGHIFNSAMAGTFLGIMNALVYHKEILNIEAR